MTFELLHPSDFAQKGDTPLDAIRKHHFWAVEQAKRGNLIAVEKIDGIVYMRSDIANRLERRKALNPEKLEEKLRQMRMMLASETN